MKSLWTLLITTLSVLTLFNPPQNSEEKQMQNNQGIIVHYRGDYATPYIHYWNIEPSNLYTATTWPGEKLIKDADDWYTKEFSGVTSLNLIFNNNGQPQTGNLSRTTGEWWYLGSGTGGKWYPQDPDTIEEVSSDVIHLHVKSTLGVPKILYYDSEPSGTKVTSPTNMLSESNNWYRFGFHKIKSIKVKLTIGSTQTKEYYLTNGEWYLKDDVLTSFKPNETTSGRSDFREETIYFLLTARFYDGDTSNNVRCWDDDKAQNPTNDPAWRGDFKGLIQKLDYIKALGFSAIWISPVVENASGYDYHGYHALDFSQVDPRLESPRATYQDLINEAHARHMKIIQDVVFNHTSNFGEKNLYPLFEKDYRKEDKVSNLIITDPNNLLPSNYSSLESNPQEGDPQYEARIRAMKEDDNDVNHIYHHEKSLSWEQYTEQTAQIAGDCVDLNTENPRVTNYLIDAYNRYIDMGVDGFRIDTVKHISRLVFDKEFNPAFMAKGGENFFMFGEVCTRVSEVWNRGNPADSAPFYTWKETKDYPWATREQREASTRQNWDDNNNVNTQPTSSNHYLDGNNYRQVDYSKKSDMNVIDFPMHWNFKNAITAFNLAKSTDHVYSDATWNVTYIDSHDYAPDDAPESQRFNQHQNVWAENLSLIFTFRGIPTIYYGSEIEFQKGKVIDVGPNAKLSNTGRAYYGDHIEGNLSVTNFGKYTNASGQIATTLNHPLAKHIRSLNLIRRGIPALQKGQYSVTNVNGGLAFKRRYTDNNTDSFALVSVSNEATFSNIPNGTYIDAVTGHEVNVTNNSLSISLNKKGNLRVYVLNTTKTPAPGKLAEAGTYLS